MKIKLQIKELFSNIKKLVSGNNKLLSSIEKNMILQGKILCKLNNSNKDKIFEDLSLAEFSIFSQW
jgi:hypothetical protein